MNISLNPVIWTDGNFTAIPSVIIDKHLRLCGSLALKVILLILRDKNTYNNSEIIRDKLKCDPSDLSDALNYWEEAGIIKLCDENDFKPADISSEDKKKGTAVKEEKKPFVKVDLRNECGQTFTLTREEVSSMIKNDKILSQLVLEAQEILGKTFNNYDRDLFVLVYSSYDLTPHFMLTLLNFCKAVNKKSLPYLKKVAENWLENGVDDNTVDKHMDSMLKAFSMEGRVKKALGLERNLIKSEKEYINKWTNEYGLDIDIIAFSYEKCVEAINKINFKYMDKILASWYQNRITTRDEAETFLKQKPASSKDEPQKNKSDFMKLLEQNYDKE